MQQTGLRFIQENLHTNKEALTIKIHSRAVKIFDVIIICQIVSSEKVSVIIF